MNYPITCFVCDTPLASINETCPKCGYKYEDIEDMFACPNKVCGVCTLTENMCTRTDNYGECPEKNKSDSKSF